MFEQRVNLLTSHGFKKKYIILFHNAVLALKLLNKTFGSFALYCYKCTVWLPIF